MFKGGKCIYPSDLQLLEEMGASEAAESGNPNVLRFVLSLSLPHRWDWVMEAAISSGSLACVKVLYEYGYERGCEQDFSAILGGIRPSWRPVMGRWRSFGSWWTAAGPLQRRRYGAQKL
jgi:hypothetical protein